MLLAVLLLIKRDGTVVLKIYKYVGADIKCCSTFMCVSKTVGTK